MVNGPLRLLIVGLDADGRSAVVDTRDDLFAGATGVAASETLWETIESPPEVQVARRSADDAVWNLGLSATGTKWLLLRLGPDWSYELHRTDSIDYDLVVEGEITLVLESGDVSLRTGDAVVIPGVQHGWRVGPERCVLSCTLLGLPPVD
jgi:mannose-6-phosphate isomerase-like protein (cupin superfamily)